jgi:hypothetical protein
MFWSWNDRIGNKPKELICVTWVLPCVQPKSRTYRIEFSSQKIPEHYPNNFSTSESQENNSQLFNSPTTKYRNILGLLHQFLDMSPIRQHYR